MNKLIQAAMLPTIVFNSLKIALVVGTILILVNQGESIFNGETISWLNLFLNYLVPYLVASYSAARNEVGK